MLDSIRSLIKRVLGPTYLKGIDTSHHQETKNWPVVLGSGKADFVYLKLSEGETYTDPDADVDVAALRESTTPWGGYHFFRPLMDIQLQAQNFWRLGQYALLPPWLDVEPVKNDPRYAADLAWWNNTPKPQIQARIKEMLDALQAISGIRPIIYSADWAWRYVGIAGWETQYRLAVASYTSAPLVPAPWTEWTFWQYSASGIVPGIVKKVDLDYFNGNITDLLDLCEEPEPIEIIARATVLTDGLRLRKYPWGPVIGSFKKGTVLDVYDAEDLETWVQVPGGWVCERDGDKFYLDLEDPEPPAPPTPSTGFDSPVGTPEERAGTQIYPGNWIVAQGITSNHPGHDLNNNVPWDHDAHAPVYSISGSEENPGVVIYAATVPIPSTWGGVIVVRYGTIYARYGHVENILVNAGDTVVKGQQLASIGEYQGDPPNFHLHFDLCDETLQNDPLNWPGWNPTFIQKHYIDPAKYIRNHRGVA